MAHGWHWKGDPKGGNVRKTPKPKQKTKATKIVCIFTKNSGKATTYFHDVVKCDLQVVKRNEIIQYKLQLMFIMG